MKNRLKFAAAVSTLLVLSTPGINALAQSHQASAAPRHEEARLGGTQDSRRAEFEGKLRSLVEEFKLGNMGTFNHGDANGDGSVDVGDVFYLINFLFAAGTLPAQSSTVTWRGPWSPTTTYDLHDAVEFQGSSWVSLVASNLAEPPLLSQGVFWDLLAAKGEDRAASPTAQQIALLRWYPARGALSFAVGAFPQGIAFDGTHMWVANEFSDSITKLRADTGELVTTVTVGDGPRGIAFDGAHIWVTVRGLDAVQKRLPSDGSLVTQFPVGDDPRGIAFDGTNIWVGNELGNSVTRLRAADGGIPQTVTVGSQPQAIAFDGIHVWVANFGSDNVMKIEIPTGNIVATIPVGDGPQGLAFDGLHMWVTVFNENRIAKFRAFDGVELVGIHDVSIGPQGIAFDGEHLWVPYYFSNRVVKYRASNGARLGSFFVGSNPFGIAFDGANIWVTNAGSGSVSKL